MKKIISIITIISSIFPLFSVPVQSTLRRLCLTAMDNNTDIQTAENDWKNVEMSRTGGAFVPSVSLSSSASLPHEYGWDSCPDAFSSSVTYSQPLPGGMVLGLSGIYSYTTSRLTEDCYISQNPQFVISLTQSLLPFWVQGKLQDPSILSVKKQSEYYYYQLLYTRRNVIRTIVQNYIYAYTDTCKINIYNNYIILLQKQIDAFLQMENYGGASKNQVMELQNKKWSYQQELMSMIQNRQNYIQTLENLCGAEIDEDDLDMEDFIDCELPESFCTFINELCDGDYDPCEKALSVKIEVLTAAVTDRYQASAPVMKFSIHPTWNLDVKTTYEWLDAWKNESENRTPLNWTVGLEVDFTPLFSALSNRTVKKSVIELEQAYKNLKRYKNQKIFVHRQYEKMYAFCKEQCTEAESIYQDSKNQFNELSLQIESGNITSQEFENSEKQMKNNYLTFTSLEAVLWLYGFELVYP